MRHRQPSADLPKRWLIADDRLECRLAHALEHLPRGSGVVVLFSRHPRRSALLRRIRQVGRRRGLLIVDAATESVARVHSMTELRRALTRRTPIIFISAIFPTRSHPGRDPLGLMRAATLARLARRQAFALGGMTERRFRFVKPLGFAGWGAIDAWL